LSNTKRFVGSSHTKRFMESLKEIRGF